MLETAKKVEEAVADIEISMWKQMEITALLLSRTRTAPVAVVIAAAINHSSNSTGSSFMFLILFIYSFIFMCSFDFSCFVFKEVGLGLLQTTIMRLN